MRFGECIPCAPVTDQVRSAEQYDYLAISVNCMYGIKATDPTLGFAVRRLRNIGPIARAGDSSLVFQADELGK